MRSAWIGALVLLVLTAFGGAGIAAKQVPVVSPPAPGSWARYRVLPAPERVPPPVVAVEIQVEGSPRATKETMTWWRLVVTKPGGKRLTVRAESDLVPMTAAWDPGRVRVARYIFREEEEEAFEYLNTETGQALLPEFDFARLLLPQPQRNAPLLEGFFSTGGYLGHSLTLDATGRDAGFEELGPVRLLTLSPGLLIGTGRNVRDVNEERLYEGDYTYRRFTPEEYAEMVRAGMNLFTLDPQQEEYVRWRPVFYVRSVGSREVFRYPEELYRSNYLGAAQFLDEPAIRIIGEIVERKPAYPWDCAEFLRRRTAYTYAHRADYGIRRLPSSLRSAGYNLGTLDLYEWDVPIWETLYQTSFYQLEAGGSGIIHEGRYQLEEYLGQLNAVLGGGLELTAEEMLRLHVAFLRGAARCTGKDWGISIYGQSDPDINPLAVTLAYDLGARYIWFWTSDHQHNLPWREQLELARTVMRRARLNPRPPREELVRRAEVAVAFPEGYTYFPHYVWLHPGLGPDERNQAGVTHREVIASAMWEGILCLKQGVPFDFVVDSPLVDAAGYRKVIRVGYDGETTVEKFGRRTPRWTRNR